MENTENNKIIAEFMGYAPEDVQKIEGFWNSPNKFPNHDYYNIMFGAMKFNSDWNWLMEVVLKIEALRDEIGDVVAYVTIESSHCEIRLFNSVFEPEAEFPTKIDAVYSCCVQFIKWYNQQNPKP